MWEMLGREIGDFCFASFTFSIRFAKPSVFAGYLGSTLRGAFGRSLYKIACIARSSRCDECDGRFKCPYFYIFETPPNPDTIMMRKYPRTPHPFVLEVPFTTNKEKKEYATLDFNIILIGKAMTFLPTTIAAIRYLGLSSGLGSKQNLFIIESVTNEGKEIYSPDDCSLSDEVKAITWEELIDAQCAPSRVVLKLETPLRVKYAGKLVSQIEFHMLIRNLLRRISSLSYFHCGNDLQIDYRRLIEEAMAITKFSDQTTWFDWTRYSSRQGTSMELGGLVGEVGFEGNLTPFMPYLLLGEKIHAGKNTSFGLGKYSIHALE